MTPEYDALIVSHGQPCAPFPAEAKLARFTNRVRKLSPDLSIGSATMAAPDVLEKALKQLKPGGLVYPMFMSDGWFVKTALAARLEGHDLEVLPPLGMEPDLADHVAKTLAAENARGDTILLAAHGSASGRPAPARAAHDFAAAVTALLPDIRFEIGFLEQPPFVADVVDGTTRCLPYFSMPGEHVKSDLKTILDEVGFDGDTLPVMSDIAGVDTMVSNSLRSALS